MNEKTFWGAVGGIVAVVLVCFYFLVWDNYTQYQETSADLSRKVKNMEKLAKRPAEELPTEELKDAHEARAEKWQANVNAANTYFADRDSRMESFIGGLDNPNVAQWEAVYRDEFKRLGDAYRAKTGLPEEEDLPFPEFGDLEEVQLSQYQKEWRIQHALIAAVLETDRGQILKLKKARTQDIDASLPLADFDRIRYNFEAALPANQIPTFMGRILGSNSINFEMEKMIVKKDADFLQGQVVKELPKGTAKPPEPNVMLILTIDALDWNPKAPEES